MTTQTSFGDFVIGHLDDVAYFVEIHTRMHTSQKLEKFLQVASHKLMVEHESVG